MPPLTPIELATQNDFGSLASLIPRHTLPAFVSFDSLSTHELMACRQRIGEGGGDGGRVGARGKRAPPPRHHQPIPAARASFFRAVRASLGHGTWIVVVYVLPAVSRRICSIRYGSFDFERSTALYLAYIGLLGR